MLWRLRCGSGARFKAGLKPGTTETWSAAPRGRGPRIAISDRASVVAGSKLATSRFKTAREAF